MITHAQITEFMQAMLAKALEKYEYASLGICLNANRGFPQSVRFELYTDRPSGNIQGTSFEECFEKRAGETPEVTAAKLRKQAASLLAEADKISPTPTP